MASESAPLASLRDPGTPGQAAPGPRDPGSGRADFLSYLARKVAAAVVSFAVLLVIGFIIFSLMPSDPVAALTRGRPVSASQLAFLRKSLGLDQPVWLRFVHFVWNTLHGQLGYSWQF